MFPEIIEAMKISKDTKNKHLFKVNRRYTVSEIKAGAFRGMDALIEAEANCYDLELGRWAAEATVVGGAIILFGVDWRTVVQIVAAAIIFSIRFLFPN